MFHIYVLLSPTMHFAKTGMIKKWQIPVTAVSQWRNDQPTSVAQVLKSVINRCGDHAHYDSLVLEIIAQLTNPRKVPCCVGMLVT